MNNDPWPNFDREEFKCSHCGENQIKDELIFLLQQLRFRLGFALQITSGYRCPTHNVAVSTTGPDGPHTTGLAADISIDREKAAKLLEIALQMPFTGIGVNQKGAARFIHLDILPRPFRTIWSY